MPPARRTAAQKAEALGESVTVNYRGHEYTVPPFKKWTITVMEESEAGHPTVALRVLLGDEQYAQFRTRHELMEDFNEFSALILKAAVGTGNS